MKLFSILVLLTSTLFPQSEHIYTNSWGLMAKYNYAATKEFSADGGTIGISFFGKVDLAAEFMNASYEVESYSEPLESSSNLIYLAYNVKPKNNSNMKFMLGFMDTSIKEKYFSGFMLGLLFSLKVHDSESFKILPGLGLIYGFLSLPNQLYGPNNLSWLDTRSLGLEINFDFKASKHFTLIFTPAVSKNLLDSNGSLSTGVSIGLLLTTANEM